MSKTHLKHLAVNRKCTTTRMLHVWWRSRIVEGIIKYKWIPLFLYIYIYMFLGFFFLRFFAVSLNDPIFRQALQDLIILQQFVFCLLLWKCVLG